MTEKIVRGISCIEGGMFVEPPYKIGVFVLDPEAATSIREMIKRFGTEYARGPVIIIRRAVATDDGRSAFFEIEFFSNLKATPA